MKKTFFGLIAACTYSTSAFAVLPVLEQTKRYMIYITQECDFYSYKVVRTIHDGHGNSTKKRIKTNYSRKTINRLVARAKTEQLETRPVVEEGLDNVILKAYYTSNGERTALDLKSYDDFQNEEVLTRVGPASNEIIRMVDKYCKAL